MARWFASLALCFAVSTAHPLSAQSIASQYSDLAKKLIDGARGDQHSLDRLQFLCDRIGNRVSGSPSLEHAIAWATEEMKRAGLQNVRTSPVKVPHWVRGSESATLLSPLERKLPCWA